MLSDLTRLASKGTMRSELVKSSESDLGLMPGKPPYQANGLPQDTADLHIKSGYHFLGRF